MAAAKDDAIRAEFIRQCDELDGLEDGIIINYVARRAIFNVAQGAATETRGRENGVRPRDPNPDNSTSNAAAADDNRHTQVRL